MIEKNQYDENQISSIDTIPDCDDSVVHNDGTVEQGQQDLSVSGSGCVDSSTGTDSTAVGTDCAGVDDQESGKKRKKKTKEEKREELIKAKQAAEEALEKINKKQAAIMRKLARIDQNPEAKRKEQDRIKILHGVVIMAWMRQDEKIKELMIERLNKTYTKEMDRELLGLPPIS